MPQVTISNLDDKTLERLESEARRRGLDVGTAAGELLRERFGIVRDASSGNIDLASLAGTWSDEEAEAFLSAVADFRRIDPDLWK